MSDRTPDYWLGSLAMTVALASREPNPRPLLTEALRKFLADHGREHPLGAYIRDELRKL